MKSEKWRVRAEYDIRRRGGGDERKNAYIRFNVLVLEIECMFPDIDSNNRSVG
jgi:hypothetical protein